MSQQIIQFPETISYIRWVGFMGFLISVVELVQDCFIVTVARVKGMLTDEMLAQKESAVKSKRAKRKGLRPKPEALIIQLVTLGSRGKQACKPSDIVRYGTLPDSQLLYIRTDKHPTHQYQMQKHPPP